MGALCCVFLSKISVILMVIFALTTGISLAYQFKEHLKTRRFILGKQKIKTPLVCTPWLVGLNVDNKARIIFFDSMSRDMFRRLRVLLINGRAGYEN